MVVKIKIADLVLMHRDMPGNTLYMCQQFGIDGKLYVEVIRASLYENG